MGVVNVTPDSFSDGGDNLDPAIAVATARRLRDEGAALIDIGGESTRPGADAVSVEEELATRAAGARAARRRPGLDRHLQGGGGATGARAGALLVNDVTALRGDPELAGAIADAGAYVCLMHMQGEPRTMQVAPRYDDVVEEVAGFLEERLAVAVAAGIPEDHVCLDPGIGFGKTPDQNLELIRGLERLCRIGRPVLVGLSRKSTLARVLGDAARTAARSARTPRRSALPSPRSIAARRIFRAHDVAAHVEALAAAAAVERGSVG